MPSAFETTSMSSFHINTPSGTPFCRRIQFSGRLPRKFGLSDYKSEVERSGLRFLRDISKFDWTNPSQLSLIRSQTPFLRRLIVAYALCGVGVDFQVCSAVCVLWPQLQNHHLFSKIDASRTLWRVDRNPFTLILEITRDNGWIRRIRYFESQFVIFPPWWRSSHSKIWSSRSLNLTSLRDHLWTDESCIGCQSRKVISTDEVIGFNMSFQTRLSVQAGVIDNVSQFPGTQCHVWFCEAWAREAQFWAEGDRPRLRKRREL
jgi:hypothetical protein